VILSTNRSRKLQLSQRKERIQRWLKEDGYAVEVVAAEGLDWLIVARHNHYPVLIGQEQGQRDRVTIRVQFVIHEGHRLTLLEASKRESLLREMFLYLMSLEVCFSGLAPELKEIIITEFVYDDALTKDTLLRRLRRVANAALLVQTVLARAAQEIELLPWEPAS
jgi:hypothetical protein